MKEKINKNTSLVITWQRITDFPFLSYPQRLRGLNYINMALYIIINLNLKKK